MVLENAIEFLKISKRKIHKQIYVLKDKSVKHQDLRRFLQEAFLYSMLMFDIRHNVNKTPNPLLSFVSLNSS